MINYGGAGLVMDCDPGVKFKKVLSAAPGKEPWREVLRACQHMSL